jgi:D-amino-acid oxidase
MKITIAGAGISGLSTAYTLAKEGHEVTVVAAQFTPNITSDRAAAFWFPYHIRNDERGIHWCKLSYERYQQLSQNAETGVSMQHLLKVVREGVQEAEMTWLDFMPTGSYHSSGPGEAPAGCSIAYHIEVPLIETQLFLPWLMKELQQMNVVIVEKTIVLLDEFPEGQILINCTALGARKLCGDTELVPVRGQVALLAPQKDMTIFLDNELPLYIVPRKDAIIVGGTYEPGIEDAVTEAATIKKLLNNAFSAFPNLRDQKELGSWAGLRPFRPMIRVERERNIIHNYGHGGSGFTCAWGCAAEVSKLVKEYFIDQ